MKESRFYKFFLFLPLAVPAIAAPLLWIESQLPQWLAWLAVYTFFSGVIGGIPYIVLVGLLLWWARGKSETQFSRALLLLPFLMLPVFAAFLVLGSLIELWLRGSASALPPSDLLFMFLGLAPFILGFGYCYVLFVFGMAFGLRRLGLLVNQARLS